VHVVRCKVCKEHEAILKLDTYRLNLCQGCFDDFVLRRTKKGIRDFKMFGHSERILVAVSGGKDSLGLWDVLVRLGYKADGFYIDLGIKDYSAESKRLAREYADKNGLTLHVRSVPDDFDGLGIRDIAWRTRRKPCSVCGTLKRHLMNRIALDEKYDVLATGHNLDDEVTTLFGNTLHWQVEYLGRQFPVLPAVDEGLQRKVKPLIYLGEKEMAAYVMVRGIPYIYEECPMAKGASSLFYKDVINQLEAHSPGTKLAFLKGFFDLRERFRTEQERPTLTSCTRCGTLTTTEVCAACRLKERLAPPTDAGGVD